MPPNAAILTSLLKSNLNTDLHAITGTFPLSSPYDQSWYDEFCTAIATGIAEGTVALAYSTNDTGNQGTPFVAGVGAGHSLTVNVSYMTQQIYTLVRNAIMAIYPSTGNIAYPPTTLNNGKVLEAISNAISQSVATHYATTGIWTLVSANPEIYMGTATITDGTVTGVVASNVQSKILENAPRLSSSTLFPSMALGIATGYQNGIQNMTSGTLTITGVCVPGIHQICGLSGTGTGTGTAA